MLHILVNLVEEKHIQGAMFVCLMAFRESFKKITP
jgi:hypothetical protein